MFQFIYGTEEHLLKHLSTVQKHLCTVYADTHFTKRTRNQKCSGAARVSIQSIIIFIQRDCMASKTKVIKFLIKRY